jgi:hypothetical protein
MTRVPVHILRDWPEDRLPVCANSTCVQEIANGQRYVIIPDSLVIICYSCAMSEQTREQAIARAQAQEEARLSRVEQRRRRVARGGRRPPGRRSSREMPLSSSERGKTRPEPPLGSKSTPSAVEQRPCPVCGLSFDPFPRRPGATAKRFCSPVCANRSRVLDRDRACELCGQLFRARTRQIRFCSFECYIQSRKKPPAQCAACGRAFPAITCKPGVPQRYCSKSCRWYGARGRTNPRPPVLRWSTQYDACVCCGSRDRRYRSRGYCTGCYRSYRAGVVPCRHSQPAEPAEPAESAEQWAS